MAHVVRPGDGLQRLAGLTTSDSLLALVRGELGLAAKLDATGLGAIGA